MFVLEWLKRKRKNFEIGAANGSVYILMHKEILELDIDKCERVIAALQEALEHVKRKGKA